MSDPGFDAGFALEAGAPGLDPARLYDALVLGAGPRGSPRRSTWCARAWRPGVIAQALGGQVAWTAEIENYPGYRLIDGAALVAALPRAGRASSPRTSASASR